MTSPAPSRRWLRFSLRTMFLAVTLLCAWLAFYYLPALRERRAIAVLKEAGFVIRYDYQRDTTVPPPSQPRYIKDATPPGWPLARAILGTEVFEAAQSVRLGNGSKTPSIDDFRQMSGLRYVTHIHFVGCGLTDEHMSHLRGYKHLEHCMLRRNRITDSGLLNHAGSTGLYSLVLEDNPISGSAFALLHWPKLDLLVLTGCPIEDDAIPAIARYKDLTGLKLNDTSITDRGLRHLANMKQLTIVDVSDTKVSGAGVAELQALPNARIHSRSRFSR